MLLGTNSDTLEVTASSHSARSTSAVLAWCTPGPYRSCKCWLTKGTICLFVARHRGNNMACWSNFVVLSLLGGYKGHKAGSPRSSERTQIVVGAEALLPAVAAEPEKRGLSPAVSRGVV